VELAKIAQLKVGKETLWKMQQLLHFLKTFSNFYSFEQLFSDPTDSQLLRFM